MTQLASVPVVSQLSARLQASAVPEQSTSAPPPQTPAVQLSLAMQGTPAQEPPLLMIEHPSQH